ncbi:hypothetical protein AVEN_139667-1 [Araneus ventricosus]|uniref:Uncharacterized protein n=1 Tax=Araneus ventricosus TaxID=182803 RepID=A0A4Y2QYH8_ARAVE|nr:hypothetical protein AVEN_60760-1 [Araneus ventricosus]GBN68462.1 hypothetical protein AVEN_139667-1 [Araneus ventricosus]
MSDLLSLSTAACQSVFGSPSQQILIYATLEARLQSTQGIVLLASLFQGASDFSFRLQSRRNSNHGKLISVDFYRFSLLAFQNTVYVRFYEPLFNEHLRFYELASGPEYIPIDVM